MSCFESTMKRTTRIGIVADYNPKNKYHVATEQSVAHAAAALGIAAECLWLDTDSLDDASAESRLAACTRSGAERAVLIAVWKEPSARFALRVKTAGHSSELEGVFNILW
jgi:CTP synthase (UTP-ammonia lyase)